MPILPPKFRSKTDQNNPKNRQTLSYARCLIQVFDRQKDLKLSKSSVRALVESLLSHLKVVCSEVSVYFVTEKKISALHNQFFQDPTPTDCISFPLDQEHLGEIFICPATAIKYAKKHNLEPYKETTLYLIHALLHLLGYDDLEAKERRTMRKMEKKCMHYLDKINQKLTPL
jgi:probable rRNA maturation factor